MSFFAVLFALVIEQFKPLPRNNWVHHQVVAWVRWTGRNFDAGEPHHAQVVWAVSVLAPAIVVAALYLAILQVSLLLALAVNVLVLYLSLGFRQFSHYYTDIRDALERGDELEAKRLLAEWRQLDASELPRTELLRHVLEHALLAAHRHVFGVFFWFILGAALGLGPLGAVLYRMAEFAARYWSYPSKALGVPANERLMTLSQQLFMLIDHVPARLTAFGFALVGNFEEAINSWRRDAGLWRHANEGVLLASAAGAVGVQLGGDAAPGVSPERSRTVDGGAPSTMDAGAEGSTTAGDPPQMGHLRSVVGLVWRSVVLWMLLVALLTLANLIH
jgi:adenosylcobinamide-phosphate synthase